MALIALGVTGGIGAYKAVEVARELLAGPSQWSPARLRTTPFLAPLHARADFRHLAAADSR
jgi:hypothetical protein